MGLKIISKDSQITKTTNSTYSYTSEDSEKFSKNYEFDIATASGTNYAGFNTRGFPYHCKIIETKDGLQYETNIDNPSYGDTSMHKSVFFYCPKKKSNGDFVAYYRILSPAEGNVCQTVRMEFTANYSNTKDVDVYWRAEGDTQCNVASDSIYLSGAPIIIDKIEGDASKVDLGNDVDLRVCYTPKDGAVRVQDPIPLEFKRGIRMGEAPYKWNHDELENTTDKYKDAHGAFLYFDKFKFKEGNWYIIDFYGSIRIRYDSQSSGWATIDQIFYYYHHPEQEYSNAIYNQAFPLISNDSMRHKYYYEWNPDDRYICTAYTQVMAMRAEDRIIIQCSTDYEDNNYSNSTTYSGTITVYETNIATEFLNY